MVFLSRLVPTTAAPAPSPLATPPSQQSTTRSAAPSMQQSTTRPTAPSTQQSTTRSTAPNTPTSSLSSESPGIVTLPPPTADINAQAEVAKALLKVVTKQKGYKRTSQWYFRPTTAAKCPHSDGEAIHVRWAFQSMGPSGPAYSSSPDHTINKPDDTINKLQAFTARFMGCPSCADQDWNCVHAFDLIIMWDAAHGRWSETAVYRPNNSPSPNTSASPNQAATITAASVSSVLDDVRPTRKRPSSFIESTPPKKQVTTDKRPAPRSTTTPVDTSESSRPTSALGPSESSPSTSALGRSMPRSMPDYPDAAEASPIQVAQHSAPSVMQPSDSRPSTTNATPDQTLTRRPALTLKADETPADLVQRGKAALTALHDAKSSVLEAEMAYQDVWAELETVHIRLADLARTKRELKAELAVLGDKMTNATAEQNAAQAIEVEAQAEVDKWYKDKELYELDKAHE